MLSKYLLYLIRWQLSTPILYIFISLFNDYLGYFLTAILSNFIGGLLFFWIDRFIFIKKK